jgi:hypothetical protein
LDTYLKYLEEKKTYSYPNICRFPLTIPDVDSLKEPERPGRDN